jgi:hypothetical protein
MEDDGFGAWLRQTDAEGSTLFRLWVVLDAVLRTIDED